MNLPQPNATRQLHDLGQSLWLDNITRGLLTSGTLGRYIEELAVTGLTSNPTIFDHAIKNADFYDDAIRDKTAQGKSGEALFFELALEDLSQAADLFRPVHDATRGVDGWVSLEVSPLLADDTAGTIKAAAQLHARAQRPNLFIKIPGTAAGLPAIEESIFAGVPVNVTLLFSREHYIAAAEAYMRGIERRLAAGRDPKVGSVASIFVSRWDVAVQDKVSEELQNRLGIAIARRTYKAYRDLLASQALAATRRGRRASRNACCGPAPAPRIRPPRTRFTLKRSRRRTPSTPYPRRRCSPSPHMARSGTFCRQTQATRKPCSRNSHSKGSTTRRWPPNSSRKAPKPLLIHGTT